MVNVCFRAHLSRFNLDSERRGWWQEFHHSSSLSTNNGGLLVVDLIKLSLLSPLVRDIIKSLDIPNSLVHLLDVNIILPDFQHEVLGLLVQIIDRGAVDLTKRHYNDLKELVDTIGLGIDLTGKAEICEEEEYSEPVSKSQVEKMVSASNTTARKVSQEVKLSSSPKREKISTSPPSSPSKKVMDSVRLKEGADAEAGLQVDRQAVCGGGGGETINRQVEECARSILFPKGQLKITISPSTQEVSKSSTSKKRSAIPFSSSGKKVGGTEREQEVGRGGLRGVRRSDDEDGVGSKRQVRERTSRQPKITNSTHTVLEKLHSVNDYSPWDIDHLVSHTKDASFFVVKSYSKDDIRESIKHGIWCGTEDGNKRLDTVYRRRKGSVFLFFSVSGSGYFCGMARIMSAVVDYRASTKVKGKAKAHFTVKWIYVKDVQYLHLRHIRLENNGDKSIVYSRDTQEVPREKGRMAMELFHGYNHATTIFTEKKGKST